MSDPRLQYVAMRLETTLDGYLVSPSVSALFENSRVCEEVSGAPIQCQFCWRGVGVC